MEFDAFHSELRVPEDPHAVQAIYRRVLQGRRGLSWPTTPPPPPRSHRSP